MNRNIDVARIARLTRFSTPEEAMLNNPMRILQDMRRFADKPASAWPGGADSDGENGVTVLGQTMTVVAEYELSHTARVGKFTLMLMDSHPRIVTEVTPTQGVVLALLPDSTPHADMDPATATQVFRHYMLFHEQEPLTLHSGT